RDIYIQTKGREKLTKSFGFGAEDLGNGLLKFSVVAWDNQENITRASTNYISSSFVFDSAEAIKNYVSNSNFLASLSKTMLDNTIFNDIKILNVEVGYQTRD
ncbi:LysR family transcriptional regulator, partial [Francisella tularensis subsp. holarctica]|nr:LysR family transcriptional regulator [Francisella tularensis subsp. holarctica]